MTCVDWVLTRVVHRLESPDLNGDHFLVGHVRRVVPSTVGSNPCDLQFRVQQISLRRLPLFSVRDGCTARGFGSLARSQPVGVGEHVEIRVGRNRVASWRRCEHEAEFVGFDT